MESEHIVRFASSREGEEAIVLIDFLGFEQLGEGTVDVVGRKVHGLQLGDVVAMAVGKEVENVAGGGGEFLGFSVFRFIV